MSMKLERISCVGRASSAQFSLATEFWLTEDISVVYKYDCENLKAVSDFF